MALAAQATALGLSAEATAALLKQRQTEPERVAVWPENWPALRVFLAASTQWRRAGWTGVPTGLDYAAIPPIAGMLGVPADADLLARLRVLEGGALTAMQEGRGTA